MIEIQMINPSVGHYSLPEGYASPRTGRKQVSLTDALDDDLTTSPAAAGIDDR
jgi:hypothetical protein